MTGSLPINSLVALAGVMIVGALIPSVSVLAVSARSVALGFAHGVFTALGIVVGDIVYILLAIYGLAALADLLGGHFVFVKYLGGVYLIWLGIVLWRSKVKTEAVGGGRESSMVASFMTGLLITLGDQKAVLFYLGLFPALLDLTAITLTDTGVIIGIAAVAVGGPKLVYAYMADKAALILGNPGAMRALNLAAGGVMIGVGVLFVVKA